MLRKLIYAGALGLALAYNWFFPYDYVLVKIDKGTLRGSQTTTWRGTKLFAFRGIPYAKPPVGKLRFKAPEEETAWTGVRNAVSYGSICPQLMPVLRIHRGDEDCLFLNVYTPGLGENEKLPVMLWLHGGAFILGSGNDEEYGPDYLVDAGVVLVTMNYRLGALGFLSTEDDEAPGNAGLKDQVAALRWVKRNIAKFGGDPDNVTVFGESAGGVSVHYHLLSPMSSGLFVRAISQSGSAIATWSLSTEPVKYAIRLAEALRGKSLSGDKAKALEILRTASYKDIVKAQGRTLITDEEERIITSVLFLPSVEKNVNTGEVFLPDSPVSILESGNYKKVPFITGYTNKEGLLFLIDEFKPKDEFGAFDDTERYVPTEIETEQIRNELAGSVAKFYFKEKPIGRENISDLIDLYTDRLFSTVTRRATELQLKSSQTPIYFYVFGYDGGLNHFKQFFGINLPGASHADDVGYLFFPKLVFWKKPARGSEDEYVLDSMVRLWTNFAKYGNPTPAGDPLTWKPVTLQQFNYLNISGWNSKLDVNPDPERVKLWVDAYEKDAAFRRLRKSTPDDYRTLGIPDV